MAGKEINKFLFAAGLFAIVCLAFGCSKKSGTKTYVLRLGHDQTTGHPYDVGVKEFANAVEKKTNGAVTIKIYPSAQLGDSAEQIEGLRIGSLDMALAAFSHVSQFVPELGIFSAPYLFDNEEQFAKVFDGKVGSILDKACQDRYGIRLLSTFTSGYRVFFNCKRPISDIKDFDGLKVRVMAGRADALTWKTFGAIPTPMPYSECYSALEAGVIDGGENEPVSIMANKFYEPCKYFAMTDHLVLPMGLFISSKMLEKLPVKYKDIIIEEARKAAIREREDIKLKNKEAIDKMVSNFAVQITNPDKNILKQKGEPIQDITAEQLGLKELLTEIRNAKK